MSFKQSPINLSVPVALAIGILLSDMPYAAGLGDTFYPNGWRRTVDRYLDGATPYDDFGPRKISITELEKIADYDRQINAPRLTADLSQIAMMYQDKGQSKKAEGLYQEVLRIRKETLPPNHPDIAAALHNLGAFYEVQKEPENAASHYQQAIDIWESSDQSNTRVVAHELADFGDFYWLNKKSRLAEPVLRKALGVADQIRPPDYELTIQILQLLGISLEEQGKRNETAPFIARQSELERKLPPIKNGPNSRVYEPVKSK
jgi:tetratricopeptide (TPR) repeat protein